MTLHQTLEGATKLTTLDASERHLAAGEGTAVQMWKIDPATREWHFQCFLNPRNNRSLHKVGFVRRNPDAVVYSLDFSGSLHLWNHRSREVIAKFEGLGADVNVAESGEYFFVASSEKIDLYSTDELLSEAKVMPLVRTVPLQDVIEGGKMTAKCPR